MPVPHVIVFASSKGGVGKTTLVRALASHWQNVGQKPAIIDADPEEGLFENHDPDGPMGKIPVLADPEVTVGNLIEELRAKHRPILVDTGGFGNQTNVAAIASSDVVIIPLKPSKDDVRRARRTMDLVEEINETDERAGKPVMVRMLLTMTQKNTVVARHVRQQLEDNGFPLMKAELASRVVYLEAGLEGLSPVVIEPKGAATKDIAKIAVELSKIRK